MNYMMARKRDVIFSQIFTATCVAFLFMMPLSRAADQSAVPDVEQLSALSDHDFVPALIKVAQQLDVQVFAEEYTPLLSRFSGIYQYAMSEEDRFSLEQNWFSRVSSSSADSWLRIIALDTAGMPELAAAACEKLLQSSEDPFWRELAWDGWVSLHLKTVDPSPKALAEWLTAAAAEVSDAVREHMLSEIIFNGPVHSADRYSRGVVQLLERRMNPLFVASVLEDVSEDICSVGGTNARMLFQQWSHLWTETQTDSLGEEWAAWLSQMEVLPEGSFLIGALAMLPESGDYWTGRTMPFALFETTEAWIAKMSEGTHSQAVNALLESSRGHYSRQLQHWQEGWTATILARSAEASSGDAVAEDDLYRRSMNVQRREYDPSSHYRQAAQLFLDAGKEPWLSNGTYWGLSLEAEATALAYDCRGLERKEFQSVFAHWLQNHPYGPVAWKVYMRHIAQKFEHHMNPVFEVIPTGLEASLYPPEPSWTGEVLAASPYICGILQVSLPGTKSMESTVQGLNMLAEGIVEPVLAHSGDARERRSRLFVSILQGDNVTATVELYQMLDEGLFPDTEESFADLLTNALADLKTEERQEVLERLPYPPVNPRSMAMLTGLLCSRVEEEGMSKEAALKQARAALQDYMDFLAQEQGDEVMRTALLQAESVALSQMLLLADHAGDLNEETAVLAERYIAREPINPYAARMLWPMALREIRFALVGSEPLLAGQWLERFKAVSRAMEDRGLAYPEKEAAATLAKRIALFLNI